MFPQFETLQKLTRTAQDAFVRMQVRSALYPILWLCSISGLLCFGFALRFTGVLQTILVILGALPFLIASFAYVFFLFADPDRLHSEDFQLRKQALELIEEKGSRIPVIAASVEAISNPTLPQLPAKTEGEAK